MGPLQKILKTMRALLAAKEPGPKAEPCPPCPPCPAPEIIEGFPTRFARLFFGVITLLVLYFSYLIIKPFLLDIFMALVLFFTAKPLYLALTRLLRGWKGMASALTCLILLLIILVPLFSLMSIIATQALDFSSQVTKGMQYRRNSGTGSPSKSTPSNST